MVPSVKRQKVAHHSIYEAVNMKMENYGEIDLHSLPPHLLPNELEAEAATSQPRSKNRRRNRHRPMASIGSDSSISRPSQRRPVAAAPLESDIDKRKLGPAQAIANSIEAPIEDEANRAGSSGYRIITPVQSPIPKIEEYSLNSVSPPVDGSTDRSHYLHSRDDLFTMDEEAPVKIVKPESLLTPPLDFVLDTRFPKPKLPHLPPIWAESRQEICEGFDWFRSYQGGVYHVDNAVKGYMLGGFAARRDVFEHGGRFIISHGGGKAESVICRDGLYTSAQASDQLAEDKSVRALLENYWTGRPLVLVIDDKYVLFPYDLTADGVTYAVLGFYTIAYAWAEYQLANNETGRVIRYKFAFQWCEGQGDPWWLDKSVEGYNSEAGSLPQPVQASAAEKSVETVISTGLPLKISEAELYSTNFSPLDGFFNSPQICNVCHIPSPHVYSSWFCLEPDCIVFWRDPINQELVEDPGEYKPGFLELIPPRSQLEDLVLLPEPVVVAKNEPLTGYAFTRGVHCPKCGRLSCRFQWKKLSCLKCSWEQHVEIPKRSAENLRAGRLPVPFEKFYLNSSSAIIHGPLTSFGFGNGGRVPAIKLAIRRQTKFLSDIKNRLTLVNSGSADGHSELTNVCPQALVAVRNVATDLIVVGRGTLLTNYFSHNAGEPYQYVGGDANTVPFEEAPAVSDARSLIQKRIREALQLNASFNEVLSCAYMERQRMAFHSDAEVGLGPLVAGLSLGSPALMHFRLHRKYDPEYEQRGIQMTVVLRHGDILVMDGAGVQDFYEHTVVPNNFRIAATARQITKQHHVKKEETP
ncbi:hypothetical protein CPB83DRAFT_273364 [Crepidotus variabilis]|uniref:Alpha-ketoglutarate-dependent dioxygenase AlkB-like domain-containing protein n=1 Tax=Crepidotus variabilis TaxID=179855 RepID=A0A9P6JQ55_9AGAR|nr:hypothetical protein CPB83DRAFT_273364 [Crepidotus variabilis]